MEAGLLDGKEQQRLNLLAKGRNSVTVSLIPKQDNLSRSDAICHHLRMEYGVCRRMQICSQYCGWWSFVGQFQSLIFFAAAMPLQITINQSQKLPTLI